MDDLQTKMRNVANLSTFSGILGICGTIGTGYLIAVETPKFNEKFKELKTQEHTKKDIFKCFVKNYKKSLIAGGATLAFQVLGISSGKKYVGYSTAAIAGIYASKNKIIDATKKVIGDENFSKVKEYLADKEIENHPHNDETIRVYNEHTGMFECTKVNLLLGLDWLKDVISGNCDGEEWNYFPTLREFLEHIEGCVYDKDLPDLDYGWCQDYITTYLDDRTNISYELTDKISNLNGEPYTVLDFNVEPYWPDKDYWPVDHPYDEYKSVIKQQKQLDAEYVGKLAELEEE